MQRHERVQRIGVIGACLRLAARERHRGAVVGQRQMIVRTRKKRAVEFAVVGEAADRDAAERHAVIALVAPDQAEAAALAFLLPPGARDLERRVAGLRSGIDEEHVIQALGRQRRDALRQREGAGMGELEGRREIEIVGGARDRIGDLSAAVAGVRAPQARTRVEQCAAVIGMKIHPFRARDHARMRLEVAIGVKGSQNAPRSLGISRLIVGTR